MPAEEAEHWRNKGNEYFKFGDFSKANKSYSTSIEAQPTAQAHANRALVCTKLQEWQQAEADCNEVRSSLIAMQSWQRVDIELRCSFASTQQSSWHCHRQMGPGETAEHHMVAALHVKVGTDLSFSALWSAGCAAGPFVFESLAAACTCAQAARQRARLPVRLAASPAAGAKQRCDQQ